MFVEERFRLKNEFTSELRARTPQWGFGTFSEVIYYRTYSRMTEDGRQEQWADTVIRVVEGVLSIRKDWYRKQHLVWDEGYWQPFAQKLATYIFEMKMLPPGRGLWAMGTDYIFQRGGASLFNCAFVDVKDDLADAAGWAMDMLMLGVGVGASTQNAKLPKIIVPKDLGVSTPHYIIPDTREGWVQSTKRVIEAYTVPGMPMVKMDYSDIRPEGTLLKGFGGVASGPQPLIDLHNRLNTFFAEQAKNQNNTRLVVDTMNAIGACVVSGNIRRSAELMTGSVHDETFLNLKNYTLNPERQEIGWMSNNSVVLATSSDFEYLPNIAAGVRDNGEPGIINLINMQKYGRVGKHKLDLANGMNPCAEICLEDRELCNLVEVFPTRCNSLQEFWEVLEFATFYASTVSLLPTHDASTNSVILRNRRIGVSVSGIADWLDSSSLSNITMALRTGYEKHVEPTNVRLAKEAGVPPSVRLTTVKPSGTISLLAGVSPGMHWPVSRYAIRRVRISESSPLNERLAGKVAVEKDTYSANTLCYSFPLASGGGRTRSVSEVSIWEQASMVAMLQREWADNSVSNTLTFRKHEESQIERVLSAFAPVVKSISMLPDQMESDTPYAQPPYEPIDRESYEIMQTEMGTIDWSKFGGSDGLDSKYCETDHCEI